MGFDAIFVEANLPESMAIDDYVVNGAGDPRRALAGLGFWALETEEFFDLIQWMRHYNADSSHSKKIHFYGIDAQFAPRAISLTLDYLKRVDPAGGEAFARATTPIEPSMASETFGKLTLPERAAIEKAIADLLARFDAEHAHWAKKTGEDAFVWARKQVDVVRQTEAYYANPDARDPSMADNVRWLLERGPANRKVAIWAHDAHIAFDPRSPAMGVSLRSTLGADYFAVGFGWAKGTVRAFHPDAGGGGKVGTFEVGAPPAGSLDERLASASVPLFAIDLRRAPPPIHRWLDARIVRREMGGVFFDAEGTTRHRSPTQSFDAFVFIADAHAARGLPTLTAH
jgi:erythromycin esterase